MSNECRRNHTLGGSGDILNRSNLIHNMKENLIFRPYQFIIINNGKVRTKLIESHLVQRQKRRRIIRSNDKQSLGTFVYKHEIRLGKRIRVRKGELIKVQWHNWKSFYLWYEFGERLSYFNFFMLEAGFFFSSRAMRTALQFSLFTLDRRHNLVSNDLTYSETCSRRVWLRTLTSFLPELADFFKSCSWYFKRATYFRFSKGGKSSVDQRQKRKWEDTSQTVGAGYWCFRCGTSEHRIADCTKADERVYYHCKEPRDFKTSCPKLLQQAPRIEAPPSEQAAKAPQVYTLDP